MIESNLWKLWKKLTINTKICIAPKKMHALWKEWLRAKYFNHRKLYNPKSHTNISWTRRYLPRDIYGTTNDLDVLNESTSSRRSRMSSTFYYFLYPEGTVGQFPTYTWITLFHRAVTSFCEEQRETEGNIAFTHRVRSC